MSQPGLINAISKSLSQLFSKPFRAVLWKSIGLTIAMFIGFWVLLQAASTTFLVPFLADYSWLSTMLTWLLGAGLFLGMGFLVAEVEQ